MIAHDRRGHGRSTQTGDRQRHGYLCRRRRRRSSTHLDLKDAIHVGHSTGGGEAARYVARHGSQGRVAKAVLIGAVPPIMVKIGRQPRRPADRGVRRLPRGAAANRAQFYLDVAAGPFYGYNRPGRQGLARQSSTTGGARP